MLKKDKRNRLLAIFIKLIMAFTMWITSSLFALEPVILSEEKGEYPLGLYLEILEDKEGKLTLDDVQKPEMESLWVRSKKEVPNYGFSKSVYWVRFRIISSLNQEYFLEVAFPLLDKIDLFITESGKIKIEKHTGDMLEFKQRDLEYRNFIFILNPNKYSKGEYFIRFESESPMQFPLVLWSPKAFGEKKLTEMLGMGLYFGVMFVMFFYNLFIWLSVRDKSYLFYVGYLVFFSIYIGNFSGISYQYFWSDFPTFYNFIYVVPIFIAIFFMLSFTSNFLQLKQNSVRFYKSFLVLLSLDIILLFATVLLSYRLKLTIAALLTIISFVWCLVVGIKISLTKYRPARFYLFAWISFIFGGLVSAFKALGLLPSNLFTDYSLQVGSALEVILLSLGLADRINDLKKENEQAQAESLANQRLAIENLEKANRVKDDFLANLSHELNTPLTIVYGYSEMLNSGKDYPEEVRDYSREIHESAEKLNDYVNDLMLMTDIESNLKVVKSNVSISQLVSTAIKQNTNLIDKRQIQLTVNTFDDFELSGDKTLLEKSISAVLKNAIIYNKQNGLVNIWVRRRDLKTLNHTYHGIEIKISDTGIGMAKEFQEKIFEKFFRIDSSLTYEVSGVGVGLFIARKIVEIHGGSLEVKSELGSGSEFTISLPVMK